MELKYWKPRNTGPTTLLFSKYNEVFAAKYTKEKHVE